MLDIRMPIGVMFLVVGVLLTAYGFGQAPADYARALGHNVDLGWGAVMGIFGLVMLAWMQLDPYHAKS